MDVMKFVVDEGNGVKGLAESGIQCVPKRYIQPQEERHDATHVVENERIPIIDVSQIDDPAVADAICAAAEEWGFFQVINHGVPMNVLNEVKEATRNFFQLPTAEKKKYSKTCSPTGNVRYGTSFYPEGEKSLEWKDYLSLLYTTEEEAYDYWPLECRDEGIEYMKKSESLTRKLLGALLKKLKIDEIDERKEEMLMGSKRINMNYYPTCPNPELTVGVGRHSDVSTLTILLQDTIGGLYVRANKKNGNGDCWIPVPPVNGALVINVGDSLQIMSNGRYRSVEHRVIAKRSTNRISVPIFVSPSPDVIIGPFDEVLKRGEKALYKHFPYADYVKHFFTKAHDGKKTIDFAKI